MMGVCCPSVQLSLANIQEKLQNSQLTKIYMAVKIDG